MIGKFLKNKRNEIGLTQKEIAKEMNLVQSDISRLERTKRTTKLFRYMHFLRSKGIDLNEYFNNDQFFSKESKE